MLIANGIPLLEFDPELNREIHENGIVRTFGPNQQVFAEGDDATFLPIVVSGRIKMVRFPEVGKEVILGMFATGEIFAIPPALDGKRFPATAIAMVESRILMIPRDKFLKLMETSTAFSGAIMKRMCGLLRARTDTVQILATPSAEHRVASVLLQLTGSGNGHVTKITHRRQDIAEMAGLTLETTIRSIRKLADRGYLKIVRGKIFVEDTKQLETLVR